MHPFFDTCKSLLEADLHIDFMRGLLQLHCLHESYVKKGGVKLNKRALLMSLTTSLNLKTHMIFDLLLLFQGLIITILLYLLFFC